MKFNDRQEAGQKLIPKLQSYAGKPDVVLVALPRGGIVLGYELAKALQLPLDLVVPRKIGAPGNEEFAIGAITEDGERFLDERVVLAYKIPDSYIEKKVEDEKKRSSPATQSLPYGTSST